MAEETISPASTLPIVREAEALRQQVARWKQEGLAVGFVPTMGALHEGHLSLVRRAAEITDKVVASVFVNPTQFGPDEDFEKYPRDPQGDAELLHSAGCDLVFLPEVSTIYPEGHCTFVEVHGMSEGFEGDQRPGHFRGVATVVAQLFNLVQPDIAVFGEKDAQQLAVIQQLVQDLHLPVKIEPMATVREPDGLAMSSRNAYLSAEDRQVATVLYRALQAARETIEKGERSADVIRSILHEVLKSETRLTIDYADVVDAHTFRPIEYLQGRIVIPVAGRLGATRLLDNLQIDMENLR